MIYALQPEIAPDIVEFFQHVRRNNVRTGASLSFITYDEAADYATDARRQPPARHQYNERGIKVLERARRDDTDTAFWQPTLTTDGEGRASFRFRMPDALSRWRITVRAVALNAPPGRDAYGQRTAYLVSHQDFYAKWTSPDWVRVGDAPQAQLALFNNTGGRRAVEVVFRQGGLVSRREVNLPRGVSYLPFDLASFEGEDEARLEVLAGGKPVDALATRLVAEPAGWRGTQEIVVPLAGPRTELDLPADAFGLRLSFAQGGSEHFLRIADSLVEYPWGCVEQTSSRLIPLAIATPLLARSRMQSEGGALWQALYGQRLRLASLAGPNAVFGWWGSGTSENAFLSAYAYYADWHAARALGLELPAAHWQNLLEIYRQHGGSEPLLHRVLALWFSQQIGLPVRTQVAGVLADFPPTDGGATAGTDGSPLMTDPDSPLGLAYARVLAAHLARQAGVKTAAAFTTALPAAQARLAASRLPSALALLLLSGRDGAGAAAPILAAVSAATPTLDRALALVWTQNVLGKPNDALAAPAPQDAWQSVSARFGREEWRWTSKTPPRTLEVEGSAAGTSAILRFDAAEPAVSALPVTVRRTLYRMEQEKFDEGKGHYRYVEIEPGEMLLTGEIYLDRISLQAREGSHRFGVLEVPLPPGAGVERSTWGVMVDHEPLPWSRAEDRRGIYGVPVEYLDGEAVTVSHLLRFAQTGRFVLPPARYYRMYQPGEKAYAEGGEAVWRVK
jgi:uncharacterized protein YfaS (alpha-2-macroglobulin family)